MEHPAPSPAANPSPPTRRLPLGQSITWRLVWMSAASALLIFALTGIVLYTALKGELLRHERDGLATTLNDISFQISRAGNTDRWSRVQLKLAALSQADQRVSFWVSCEDERFRYGKLAQLQGKALGPDSDSIGMLHLAGKDIHCTP